jgi:hypothetical protein
MRQGLEGGKLTHAKFIALGVVERAEACSMHSKLGINKTIVLYSFF